MNDNISVALTFKNRAHFLDQHLHYLVNFMKYDMKKVEICISDGNSTDNLFEIIEKWYKHFYQIKYAISDRNALPFKIPTNNPACDINSLICNLVTFEKVIKTDAEVFAPTTSFAIADRILEDKDAMLWYANHCYDAGFGYNYKESRCDKLPYGAIQAGGLWHSFNKSTFIDFKGIEEKFVFGFAFEDTHFCERWKMHKKLYLVHQHEDVVYHFHHGYEKDMTFNMKLWKEYSYPLYQKMLAEDLPVNENNPDWQRPEMIKDIRIWKHDN